MARGADSIEHLRGRLNGDIARHSLGDEGLFLQGVCRASASWSSSDGDAEKSGPSIGKGIDRLLRGAFGGPVIGRSKDSSTTASMSAPSNSPVKLSGCGFPECPWVVVDAHHPESP